MSVTHKFSAELDSRLLINENVTPKFEYGPKQEAILNDQAFEKAFQVIGSWRGYQPTDLIELPKLAAETNVKNLFYKDESTRFGLGSFKALGGAYAVAQLLRSQISENLSGAEVDIKDIVGGDLKQHTSKVTVCCATDGNHGRSVAWGAQNFGCNCKIFIHETVSEGRKTEIEKYGAEVIRTKGNYDESVRIAKQSADENGWFVVSDTSYPGYIDVPKDVMQGYEIMAKEALDEMGEPPTHIFLQTGVGGMAAAIAAFFVRNCSERPKIILADPDQSACWYDSIKANEPRAVEGDLDTIMAGLACGEISVLAWTILQQITDAVVMVPDAHAIELMKYLSNPENEGRAIVAGESAVAGLAAFLAIADNQEVCRSLEINENSKVLIFGTEGDTDKELYTEIVGMSGEDVLKQAV